MADFQVTGSIRLPVFEALKWRNSGDDADLTVLTLNDSNVIIFGLGVPELNVRTDRGLVVRADSSSAFEVRTAAGNDRFVVDTSNSLVKLGSTALTLGATPALSGSLRLTRTSTITWRDDGNEGDLTVFSVDNGDTLTIGTVLVKVPAAIALGAIPATTGTLRLSNASSIVARNAGNNGDLNVISFDTSSNLIFGDVSMPRITFATGPVIDFPSAIFLGNSSFLSLATAPAQSGTIRLANASSIVARNAVNNGDLTLLSITATDFLNVGDANINGVIIPNQLEVTGPLTVGTTAAQSRIEVIGTAVNGFIQTFSDSVNIGTDQNFELNLIANGGVRLTVRADGNIEIPRELRVIGNVNEYSAQADVSTLLSTPEGATATAVGLIPAGVLVLGITARVTTTVTGPAGFDIGDGVTVDRWGNSIAVASGTTVDFTDAVSTSISIFPTATDVVVTSDGVDFTGGVVRITVHYILLSPPTL